MLRIASRRAAPLLSAATLVLSGCLSPVDRTLPSRTPTPRARFTASPPALVASPAPQDGESVGTGSPPRPGSPQDGAEPPETVDESSSGIARGEGEEPVVVGPVMPEGAASDDRSSSDAAVVPAGPVSAHASIGFTLDPSLFLMSGGADWAVSDNVQVGPQLQLAVGDERVVVAPAFAARYLFDLESVDRGLRDLHPLVQGGVGFVDRADDRGNRNDDDIGFLLNLGFGVEYRLSERVSVGNDLLFNILPVDALNENFFFSWRFVSVRFHF